MSLEFTPFRVRERATVASWVLIGVFLVVAGTFFRAQVLSNADYRRMSENNRLRPLTLAAPRGQIFDRNGKAFAENASGFTVKLVATSEDSLKAVVRRLIEVIPGAEDLEAQILKRYASAPYQPVLVFPNASLETVAALEEHRYLLPGLVIRTEPRRYYRAGKAVAHLVGYVAEVADEELAKNRYPGAQSGTLVGKDGLEAKYDSVVRGIEGQSFVEVDARGRMVRDGSLQPAFKSVPGEAIRTTIDLDLQTFIDSMWTADRPGVRGSMVAMTPDGQILALYSAPTFDPNEFITGVSSRRWAELNNDPAKPLQNRAFRGTFPPGSPFKLVTAAIALKRGLVTFSSHMPQACTGGFRFGNRVFHCWKKTGHGSLDLTGAIAASCDVYFYQLGMKIGMANMLSDVTALGLGSPTGIDLRSERSSIFPPSLAYYDRVYGKRGWTQAAILNLSIGQGENAQTLMSITRFYAALAGNGTIPIPYVVNKPNRTGASLGLDPEQLKGLQDALVAVVAHGTAAASGGRDLKVAGKTGTAQNPHGEDHGWFIAFAPADNPKIVVGSVMEFAKHGTVVAPFVVRAIRRYLQQTDPELAKAPIKIVIQDDSATTASELPDSTARLRNR